MGLIDWDLKYYTYPRNMVEINYTKYGKKLIDQDLVLFEKITDELINKLRSNIKIQFLFFIMTFMMLIMGLFFTPQEYELLMMNLTLISLLALAYFYLVGSVNHDRIGIYERSWIKFLKQKQILTKITLLQNFTFKTTSIVLPLVKSYLEQKNIPLTLTETS